MSNQNKVVRFKKRRTINIGVIVFIILFVYIAINVSIYFTKNKLSIYEVHVGATAVENRIKGIILRDEQLVYNVKAGYISYLHQEGARVSKKGNAYSVNENGQVYDLLENNDIAIRIEDRDNAKIKRDIKNFSNTFTNSDFDYVYRYKESARSTVIDLINNTVTMEEKALVENNSYAYQMFDSEESGIISYYMDSYEDVTPEAVTMDIFKTDSYQRTSLRTTDIVAKNSPIYKLITSDVWKLVLPLTKDQYDLIAERDAISFTVIEDNFDIRADLSFIIKDSAYYAVLTMNKFMTNYLDQRFLDIELNLNTVDGLKIPASAIIEKDFYLVPKEYFSQGAESTKTGLIKKEYNKSGDVTYQFVETDICYEDGAYNYIDADLFEAGTRIQSSADSGEYTLAQTGKLLGVYNVNLGYAVFKRIEILEQNEEYCIVAENIKNSLSAYDQIALDGSTAVDQAIIY